MANDHNSNHRNCKTQDGKGGKTASESERSSLSHFFERVDDIDSLTPDDFLDRFERFGFLWFKANGGGKPSAKTEFPTGKQILDFVTDHHSACEASWTIENSGNCSANCTTREKAPLQSSITPRNLRSFSGSGTSFYVSTIVHRHGGAPCNTPSREQQQEQQEQQPKPDDGSDLEQQHNCTTTENGTLSQAHRSLMEMIPQFDNVFEDIYENGDPSGTWLFLGHHGQTVVGSSSKKQKLSHDQSHRDGAGTLMGRAEHVDEVTHSGTYHIQIAGTKTWKIRPHPDSLLSEELLLDDAGGGNDDGDDGCWLRDLPGAEREAPGNDNGDGKACWRIKIQVQEGDVFVLNTKIWYHCTELNTNSPHSRLTSSPPEWSISVAQDFYLPVPCPRDVRKGDVVYGGQDQEIPDELPRSDHPSCALVEVDAAACNGNDSAEAETEAETEIALVALRDMLQGELLTIAFDPEEDELGNGNEQIDPRVISRQDWSKNEIVLRGKDRMPQDIPRSYDPNCELVRAGNSVALRALEDIPEGGVFCILPDEDEDYEEVEVDLGTGELVAQLH